ncbi:MAG: cytochrome c maturation protein CcmE [Chlamydiae bacterium]|nr:cytochrome c maturation protein CcmE [Chlamydiota bacterium]
MNPKNLKFIIGILIILGTLTWLALEGFKEGKAYYITISELQNLESKAKEKRVRVAGIVVPESIQRKEENLNFSVSQEKLSLNVHYIGRDPVPDTFKEGAQVVVEGKLRADNVFLAEKIQAKCASKYEKQL